VLPLRHLTAALLMAGAALHAHAGLFDDDEARKAILDLRQRLAQSEEQNRARQAELQNALNEQVQQLRRSLLEINTQLELLRGDISKMRGQEEQLARDLADLQRRQKDIAQGVEERIRKIEPQKVSLDGKEFLAEPEEKRAYDEALAVLRGGDFNAASNALSTFLKRYPASGFSDSARFWLGNALYGKREYKDAISTFRAFVSAAPSNPHAPEALLAIANTQAEMKDNKAARKTLDELIKSYPQSEAAQAGRERMAALK
jgi:tol-pal system protein YbgF